MAEQRHLKAKTKIKLSYGLIIITSPPKVIWKEPRCHPSWQRMDSSAACASCALPTADEFNHSAASRLHPDYTDGHTTTAYTALA